MINCPFCGSNEQSMLASMGELSHARCRHCGTVFCLDDVISEPLAWLSVDGVGELPFDDTGDYLEDLS